MHKSIGLRLGLLLFLSINLISNSFAQSDSLSARIELSSVIKTNDALPHWLAFNRFGFYNTDSNDGYLRGEIKKRLINKNSFFVDAEIDVLTKMDEVFFHESYINLGWKGWGLKIGKNEVNNLNFPDDLSTGHFFISRNARTMPRVSFGIFEFADVPGTQGYVQVRGALSQSILEDDRVVENALYHEKSAFIRTQKLPINVQFGLDHNALFGGELNGRKLSSNYFEVFFGSKSSDSQIGGDNKNAAGAHFGLYKGAVMVETEQLDANFFHHQPWGDGSGLQGISNRNYDYAFGVHLRIKNLKWITEFLYEGIYTMHQSGEGIPDPIVNGRFYQESELRNLDYDQFVLDEFGIVANNLTFDELMAIIEFETNNNLSFGGRDSYYVNNAYPDGNTYEEFVIGNSLFLTASRLRELNGISVSDRSLVINNRVVAEHYGFKGNIVPLDVEYKLLLTFTKNYGTYAGKYGGDRTSWDLDRNYYFREGVKANYFLLDLKKDIESKPYGVNVSLAYDTGGFGNFFGMLFGIEYQIR